MSDKVEVEKEETPEAHVIILNSRQRGLFAELFHAKDQVDEKIKLVVSTIAAGGDAEGSFSLDMDAGTLTIQGA
jgi:hypothetical protein